MAYKKLPPVPPEEAAYALGYGNARTFFRIILPQVVKRVVPASSNEIITLVKDTSLDLIDKSLIRVCSVGPGISAAVSVRVSVSVPVVCGFQL